jgi:predicted acyltransferase
LAGFIVAYLSSEWRWFAASILLLANWPFTLMVIRPVNKRLMAMQIGDAGVESRALLVRWGKLHNFRSALGSAATIFFAWALSIAG